MAELSDLQKILPNNASQFVNWFRSVSPYIHGHRGRTFVISLSGEAVQSAQITYLLHDIALLSSLGIRLVLVHGNRPQIEAGLQAKGLTSHYFRGQRVTDEIALHCAKAACGEVSIEIQRYLSMGLANLPTVNVRIPIATGNFITARPLGIRDGVDYGYTGEVRRVDVAAIARRLDEGCIVLISPIGYSPTGEVFNLLNEDVAMAVASALHAAKWVCLSDSAGLFDNDGQLLRQLTLVQAQQLLARNPQSVAADYRQLTNAVKACQNGVHRVHLVTRHVEGSLLLELFSRDGIGTLISTDEFDPIRKATIEDVGGLLELIQPLEAMGILVRRSREKLEMEIDYFTVQERDGMIVACAALYSFAQEKMAELACLAVHPHYRGENRGDGLLAALEHDAQQLGITDIFVLTTHTAHWFQERGFIAADLDLLPISRRALYNYQRKSKVFIKHLV
ncbi:MAG: amino-acid N-acetyltransferase [Beggiatoa sp. IS2]|nr:MAG: amino-acid N-acetyltransferase [Beggiatoa sp. IS2]